MTVPAVQKSNLVSKAFDTAFRSGNFYEIEIDILYSYRTFVFSISSSNVSKPFLLFGSVRQEVTFSIQIQTNNR